MASYLEARVILLAVLIALAGCDESTIETPEECVEVGGRVAIGPVDNPECAADEVEIGELTWAKCCLPTWRLDWELD
jgi:hypothetical protein